MLIRNCYLNITYGIRPSQIDCFAAQKQKALCDIIKYLHR